MTDEATNVPAEEATDTGPASADTQAVETSETPASEPGAETATQSEATATSSPTTETRSESPEDLLNRLVPESATAKPAVTAPDQGSAQASPYAHLSPAFQQRLANPEQAKHLENLDKLFGRQAQEVGTLRQQIQSYQGLPPPEQLRSLLDQQKQQAEIAKLKPWVTGHPESGQAQQRIARARMFKQAVDSGVPEEALGKLAKEWRVTADDVKLLNEYDDHKSTIQDRLATDFDGLFNDYFQSRFSAAIQQWEGKRVASIGATQFLEQNQELLQKHQDAAVWAMQNENRREVALRLAQLEEENSKLRGSAVKGQEAVHAAEARNALAKTRAASVTRRDPATNADSIGNVYERAKAGKLDDRQLLQELYKARGITG